MVTHCLRVAHCGDTHIRAKYSTNMGNIPRVTLISNLRDIKDKAKVANFIQSIQTNQHVRRFYIHVNHFVVMEMFQALKEYQLSTLYSGVT